MDPFALHGMGLLCPWSRRSKGPKVYMTERRCPAHCALDLMGIERGVWSRHVGGDDDDVGGDDDDDSADRGDSDDGMTITMAAAGSFWTEVHCHLCDGGEKLWPKGGSTVWEPEGWRSVSTKGCKVTKVMDGTPAIVCMGLFVKSCEI